MRIAYTVRNMIALRNLRVKFPTVAVLRASCTHQKKIKFFMVQWSNHTEDEATWEREDFLRAEYPHLFEDQLKSQGPDFS